MNTIIIIFITIIVIIHNILKEVYTNSRKIVRAMFILSYSALKIS